ncbi:MAG TPA: discoidin domain-containing protein [Candidatus Binatia bacterium]|nr:discoidin domain-containing protein [Candidatus Binatia bacterium]
MTAAANGDLVVWSGDAVELEGWSASAAPGSRARLAVEPGPGGRSLRLDFDLAGPGAWAVARRAIAATLPRSWVAALALRGAAPSVELQVKLVDATGANVWWWRRAGALPRTALRLVLRRAALAFAWGPAGGGEPEQLGAVEVAVAAGEAGAGTLWIDDLRLEPRPLAAGPPRPCGIRASSSAPGHGAARVLDDDVRTSWRPGFGDARPWLEIDLGGVREWGGLAVDFVRTAPASRVLASDDGTRWTPLADDPGGAAGRRWLRTGEAESRFARLALATGTDVEIGRVAVVPIELAAAPARWAAAVAAAAPRGRFPRHLLGEQAYWAVVGGDGDRRKGLLGEDGALEVDVEAFTLEPFLAAAGRVFTWADAEPRRALRDGDLPIPSVEWTVAGLRLRVTAFALGAPDASALVAQYVVENATGAVPEARLLVAIRPFQVTPAWQSLGLAGAIAPITSLARAGPRVRVNGTHDVVAVTAPDAFGAAPSEDGLRPLFEGRFLPDAPVTDPLGFAEGALAFDLRLPAGGSETVVVAVPVGARAPALPAGLTRAAAAAWGVARLDEAARRWRTRLAGVPIALPPCAAPVAESLRASLAWILVNRDGPRLQPGPRAYRRTWIRDGAFMAVALAEMGFADEARAFFRWYAPHQRDDGRVPCAVDDRGVDPTVEHDSHGELAWGAVEVFRLTDDRAFLRALWPHVRRAAQAIAALRAERTGAAFRDTACFGLLPESISHEGYASRPVHAYWDDFFAVCGLAAAADAAAAVGEPDVARRIAAVRDAMRRDLLASIARTRAAHDLDFVPASVELADLDPSAIAVALDPCGVGLPRVPLARTFERCWEELEARRRGVGGDRYSPYEVRNATAFLLLGWKARAGALLDWLVAEQRPRAWRQWPEIAHRDPRAPRFLGDLPHGWVAASFVRAVRRLVAWERHEDGALVVAAGIPEPWVREAPGVRVRGLPTRFGALHLAMSADGGDEVRVVLGGVRPPGGIVIESPSARPLRDVGGDSRARVLEGARRVWLPAAPAALVLRPAR